jgi:hypothetical protein
MEDAGTLVVNFLNGYHKETRTIGPAQMHFVGSASDTGELATLFGILHLLG